MEKRVSTDTLAKRVIRTKKLDQFLENHKDALDNVSFSGYLEELRTERGMSTADVIRRSQLERSYGYQIFRGLRVPSRDKLLMLALGMGLTVDETRRLLLLAGRSPLYPRLKRDAVLLYCVKEKTAVYKTQEILSEHGLTLLGEAEG